MAEFSYADSAATQTVHYIEPSPTPTAGPAWFFNESSTLFGSVYLTTLTGCNASGASVTFGFNGSNIAVFGSVVNTPDGAEPPVSVYSVDGSDPTTFTAPQTTGRSDAVMFYKSSTMPLTNHTLTINVSHASPAAPYYLDYLQYSIDVLPLAASGSSSSVTPTASGTSTSLQPSDSATSTSSPPPTAGPVAADTKQTAPTGAIVGGVVGGLAVLCLIIAALYWRRNRRPSGEFGYGTKAHQDAPPAIVPFVTASSPSLHGHTQNPALMPHAPRPSRELSGSSGDDTMSQITSSGVATSSPSEGNATAPSHSEHPPAASTARRRTFLSYMRPPSTEGEEPMYHDVEAFSDRHGGGESEILPAYTPGPS